MTARLQVVRTGPLLTVQDLGRPGWAHLGVPRSGALDAPALRWANRLVGNDERAAGLETTLAGCAVRCTADRTVAVTGAPATVTVDGRGVAWGLPVRLRAGAVLDIGPAASGVRSYLAVAGGIAVPPVLGSRSTDLLSGLGPAALSTEDSIPLAEPVGSPPPIDVAPAASVPERLQLRVRPGPRADWITARAWRTLTEGPYETSPDSDRVGVRLHGPALERATDDELPSEGLVLGGVQVPGDGLPLVFLADHPTTGGYPVIGVVEAADLPVLAQARPGTTVTFRTVTR